MSIINAGCSREPYRFAGRKTTYTCHGCAVGVDVDYVLRGGGIGKQARATCGLSRGCAYCHTTHGGVLQTPAVAHLYLDASQQNSPGIRPHSRIRTGTGPFRPRRLGRAASFTSQVPPPDLHQSGSSAPPGGDTPPRMCRAAVPEEEQATDWTQ